MRLLDVGPFFAPEFQRTKTGDENVAGVEFIAVLLQRLIQHLAADVMIALRDERHLRIAHINILSDRLDAGVDRLLNDILYRLRLAMADDDALHAERNR